jgi:signal transduction histidine kinase
MQTTSQNCHTAAFGAVTDRSLAVLRLFLAFSALLIILVDPAEPSRLRNVTHYALVAYIVYSLAVYVVARRSTNFPWRAMHYVAWVDVLWYSALITLSAGTNAVFFFFYLFAIIAGSSRGGTRLGLALTAVSTASFLILNILLMDQLNLDVQRFARRTVYLATLGSFVAYWGGAEVTLRRQLTFLKELSQIANPRFGVERTIRNMLRKFLAYYDAEYCFLLIGGGDLDLEFYRVARDDSKAEVRPMRLREGADIPLLNRSDPTTAAFVERESRWKRQPSYRGYNARTQESTALSLQVAIDTAERLGVRSFITAPLLYRERIRGRVLVGTAAPERFDIEHARFLQQAAEQVLPLIENVRLVDRLASEAAEGERRKIARSVHDRVIQPYLGLQIGLKALQQELSSPLHGTWLHPPGRSISLLDQLVAMTREGIDELREYVSGLKHSQAAGTSLVSSLQIFAGKFESATGIHVEVTESDCDLMMSDRLSTEIFQMTAEALSNVHRHTHSGIAEVRLVLSDISLQLSVENDSDGKQQTPFSPRSILERAESLGARTEVLWPEGKTLVRVEVPL